MKRRVVRYDTRVAENGYWIQCAWKPIKYAVEELEHCECPDCSGHWKQIAVGGNQEEMTAIALG